MVNESDLEYTVYAFSYPDEKASSEVMERAFRDTESISVTRMTNPERTEWVLAVVDATGGRWLDDFDWSPGVHYDLVDGMAEALVARRMRVGREAWDSGKRDGVKDRHHFENGAFLGRDGSLLPHKGSIN